MTLCEKGDKLLEEEIAKVYKGKKIAKGQSFPWDLDHQPRLMRRMLTTNPRHITSHDSLP